MVPQFITIHSTGNLHSTARNERAWLVNPINNRQASWHIAVDDKDAIEAIPLNEVAWHAGDNHGQGNRASIGIEICESGDRAKTLVKAVMLIARLLKERGLGIDKLRRHFDWNRHICPRILAENNWAGWEKFKQDVQMDLIKTTIPTAPIGALHQPDDWARDDWEWARLERLLDGSRPRDGVTRQELAVILKRLVERK